MKEWIRWKSSFRFLANDGIVIGMELALQRYRRTHTQTHTYANRIKSEIESNILKSVEHMDNLEVNERRAKGEGASPMFTVETDE